VLRSGETMAPVLVGSSLTGAGLDEMWSAIDSTAIAKRASGELQRRRTAQADAWLDEAIRERLLAGFASNPAVQQALAAARAEVRAGRTLASAAARQLLQTRGR
jgi:LAO/AO transport system kinase